ncbi:MAG TPA: DNA repair protein RecO [Steroidobacteraceae bacterium]|jgi:DNA repair protein RecO (recombination protein O)
MSRAAQRVQLAKGYVLHQRPFRDSSLIVELFARDYGRLTTFARAARGPRPRFGLLQPFAALLLSWSGRGEAAQLTGAEPADGEPPLPAARLMSGFYLNELLLKLLTPHDPYPELFDRYQDTLAQLRSAAAPDPALRRFEARLLDLIGYGLNLAAEADTGDPVRGDAFYQFQPGVHGFVIAAPDSAGAIGGGVLQRLARDAGLEDDRELQQARVLMRAALDHCLDGRTLTTRVVARSLRNYPRRERSR